MNSSPGGCRRPHTQPYWCPARSAGRPARLVGTQRRSAGCIAGPSHSHGRQQPLLGSHQQGPWLVPAQHYNSRLGSKIIALPKRPTFCLALLLLSPPTTPLPDWFRFYTRLAGPASAQLVNLEALQQVRKIFTARTVFSALKCTVRR